MLTEAEFIPDPLNETELDKLLTVEVLIEVERLASLLLLIAMLSDADSLSTFILVDIEALLEAAEVLKEALSL
ncbi:hypothetical protein M3M35_06965 [Fructilactobacillus myrtifloralis]|uniref:Uncharacterized protein n=1 Tax=Fructilactobacillus myrtifloralis TaxID=2940301 RepID=A0ABY5BS19_9LACO|nr:hypothetical protein [Fructilactobacillus myrtifloralis]USS85023.1 hypothetical protein M3M35_06965 [Fructilactobacillus myrtifloralis]